MTPPSVHYRIVTDADTFIEVTSQWNGPVVCDVETFGKPWEASRKLLGVALSNGQQSIYIPINTFEAGVWTSHKEELLWMSLQLFFKEHKLVGHNFTYDKRWVDDAFRCDSSWVGDTRLMWHLSSAPNGPRSYGLKEAQKTLLGWEETNERELEAEVIAKGGKLKDGQHYLASLPTLAKYACLDAYSTFKVYEALEHFFDTHAYWGMLHEIMAYNRLLYENWHLGVPVDVEGLQRAHKRLIGVRNAAKKRLERGLDSSIKSLEADWVAMATAAYKRDSARQLFLSKPEKWPKFNWNSDSHKRDLFYHKMKNPVVYETDSGKPAVDADSVKCMEGPWKEAYLKYERANTLVSNFTGPYLDSVAEGYLHPGFNICGTVSYRLSGFKPYLLNAPFDEKAVMKNFVCPPGYTGIHTDLAAIEPNITAHFSDDPYLLKVFRDGLGDIYLDLALDLLPHDEELRNGYNARVPITPEVKARFKRQRAIAKVIQLAVQYTGTGKTVARNLTRMGFPTSFEEANAYVGAYWRKFRKVARWQYQLREVNRKDKQLRNVIGRIIRVPDPEYKDLPNRFIQSSAHDCLIKYILEIDRLRKEYKVDMRPMLIDCHDSTSWCVRSDQIRIGERIFKEALENVNKELDLCVTIKAETKRFKSFAGLKGED